MSDREEKTGKNDNGKKNKGGKRNKIVAIEMIILVLLIMAATAIFIQKDKSVKEAAKIHNQKAKKTEQTPQAAQKENEIEEETEDTEEETDDRDASVPDRSNFAVQPGVSVGTTEQSDEKIVYLTLDDGPSDNTQAVLDILDKYNAKATFFVTGDGTKRILISRTQNYQAVVDLTEVSKDKFTYKRLGKDKLGNDVEVYVEHIPYHGKKLAFTNGREALTNQTGKIVTNKSGDKILGTTLWNGTKVVDKNGNDVTAANQNFISLAKFDPNTSKYEFFNLQTGETRGDFGYFQVVDNNKIRAHVSIGTNRYGAALELTELNNDRFTYTRMGKDNAGNDIQVFVEHEPYQGTYHPAFTF